MQVRNPLVTALLVILVLALGLPEQVQAQGNGSFVAGEVLVKFRPGAAASAKADAHRQARGVQLAEVARTGVQRVAVGAGNEQAAIARYARNPNVLFAEPNFIRRIPAPIAHDGGGEVMPGDFYFDEQYGLHNTGQLFVCIPWIDGELCLYIGTPDADIDAPEAWAMTTGDPAVKVAVIDSGVDYTHPDLAPNWAGGDDFYFGDGDPMDDHGHGTHVAGTVAAAMNNPTGSPAADEGVVGVAPNVRILGYKVCAADGTCSDFAIQQAIARAIDDGARVINMSLGSIDYSQGLDEAVQDAWASGLVIVAGAGNNGTTALFYPAALDHVISVGAFDEDHLRASFSNHGSWVDISAPGNVIMSTYPIAACGGATTTPGDTGCYNWLSGTSMATPHVAGAAALVWSRPDVSSNAQVVDIIQQSADPQGAGTVRLDSWTIHGGLNIHDALSHGVSDTNLPPIAHAGSDQTVADADGDGFETVMLDGTGSTDTDGSIVSYEWREGDQSLGTDALQAVSLDVGPHALTLVVTDDGGMTGTDGVIVTVEPFEPPAEPDDVVAVRKASYHSKRQLLTVEATSTAAPDATLTVFDAANPATPIGVLGYTRKGVYAGSFTMPAAPGSVLVTSSEGGSATSIVSAK